MMSTSRFTRVASLTVLVVLASVPAAAQALESHWGTRRGGLGKGAPHTVVGTKGQLEAKVETGPLAGTVVRCDLTYKGEIWNPVEGDGEDQINSMAFSKCKSTPADCIVNKQSPIAAVGLPWHSVLFREPPIGGHAIQGDTVEGVRLEISCAATANSVVVEGSISGPVVEGTGGFHGVLENSEHTVEVKAPEFRLQIKSPGLRGIRVGR
jgi:hypothetical protein